MGGIQGRFEAFDREHPEIYRALVRLARSNVRMGLERFSIDYLFHILRWRTLRRSRGAEDFRLNDHFTSRYARLIERREPDLRGCFSLRGLRAN